MLKNEIHRKIEPTQTTWTDYTENKHGDKYIQTLNLWTFSDISKVKLYALLLNKFHLGEWRHIALLRYIFSTLDQNLKHPQKTTVVLENVGDHKNDVRVLRLHFENVSQPQLASEKSSKFELFILLYAWICAEVMY